MIVSCIKSMRMGYIGCFCYLSTTCPYYLWGYLLHLVQHYVTVSAWSDFMSISDQNTRMMITLPKELYKQLTHFAEKDKRSLSNLCVKILSEYLEREGEHKA